MKREKKRRGCVGVAVLVISLVSTDGISQFVESAETQHDLVFVVSERGAHHRVWERTEYETRPDGSQVPRVRSYTELSTGMHYNVGDGKWLESKEEIEILPGGAGAKAEQGQHKVIFPANVAEGLIEMNTPDNKWLRSSVLGLSYYDTSSGESVLIAEIKDSVGELYGKNVVLYADAFTDVQADVRYTYRLSGFEQDIILREQPPSPAEFGLNPQTTRLQVLTEFFDPPQPVKREQIVRDASGTEMTDEALDFGVMQMAQGKAFSLEAGAESIPVTKLWLELDGRDFLIEEVEVQAVEKELEVLPKADGASLQPRTNAVKQARVGTPALPVRRQAKAGSHPMRMAQAAASSRGFVLDYITLNSGQTNYIFKGDTTYYISGSFSSYGTNQFEGGAVIKYATNGALNIAPGPTGSPVIRWLAGAYRPVVFTAKDDNSVGETISGSTGNPTGYYGNPMLTIAVPASPPTLTGFRMAYAQKGLAVYVGTFSFYDAQFVNCQKGLSASSGVTAYLRNALFANTRTNLEVMNSSGLSAQNVTFSGSSLMALGSPTYPDSTLRLTNCIIANVTNLFSGVFGATNASFNGFYQSPNVGGNTFTNTSYPFQTVGAGNYYLTDGCSFMNAGTTNIETTLLANLKKKTTYPPMVFSNTTINVPTNFDICAQRDTDTPDLGYHYDPMDYVFGGCDVNTNITFALGVAAGWFRTASGWYHTGHGIHIGDRQTVTFDGTAEAPCWWVRANTVQEQGGNNIWQGGYGPGGITSWANQDGPYTNAAIVQARFLRCAGIAGYDNHFRDDYGILIGRFTDSEFYSGGVGGYVSTYYFTNCLFFRSGSSLHAGRAGNEFFAQNSTWYGGSLYLTPTVAVPITIKDSAFDGTYFSIANYGANATYASYNYNAYTNASNPFPFGGNHKSSVTFNWQTGALGGFYLPTNSVLINAGSTNAHLLGLYHFTTQTNQMKETNSMVDIGYHYVAADESGSALDTDADGIADYEDADSDGDAMPDNWECQHFGDLAQDGSGDYDQDGWSNLAEYDGDYDPNSIVFDVEFDNLRVNANTANGFFNILKGVPDKMAVLVDSIDFTAATWIPYTTNLSVDLGSPDGPHDVWIGLKGRADTSEATWGDWPLTRDTTPPVIIITNPVVTTISQPILQLQGYSLEPLGSLYYDVTNAAGSVTNEQGYVTKQWFDTNLFDFTTNWFECVDIELTNGNNTITLRATDRAGNVTTNVYVYVLDYTGDTNSPALTVYWPQDGAQVSGDSFTFRGWLDDATATVTAQIVDTNGVTNVVSGLLERDGLLWVEDLPLGGGTNTLILTMADEAGNVSITNFSVIQSGVLLALDDLSGVDLNQPTITVTGTINVDDHTVWVNGVKATMTGQNGAGLQTWSAENVPVNGGGTAVIQSTAIPNTDNGGNGTGGSGGSGATMQNPGNPSSPDGKAAEGPPDKPTEIVVTHYHKERDFNALQLGLSGLSVHDTENIKWDLNKPGHWNSDGCWGGNGDFYFAWTDREWDESGVGTQTGIYVVRGPDVCGVKIPEYSGSYHAASGWPGESCQGGDGRMVQVPLDDPWIQVVKRDARTLYELRTGGKKAVKGRKNLFVLTGLAVGHADMFYPEIDYYPETYAIANEKIVLGDLGKLGSDGVLYKALGNGETHDVTPTVPGSRYYRYGQPGQSKHRLIHLCYSDIPANKSRTTIGVGEEVDFYFEPALPQPTLDIPTWTASAGGVNPGTGSGTWFTAPDQETEAVITFAIRDVKIETQLNVLKPEDVQFLKKGGDKHLQWYTSAGMVFDVLVLPTTVSFYAIHVREGFAPQTSVSGNWGLIGDHPQWNDWMPIGMDNMSDGWFDKAWSLMSGVQPGGYTWVIPWRYRVGESGDGHIITSVNHVFVADQSGTAAQAKRNISTTGIPVGAPSTDWPF